MGRTRRLYVLRHAKSTWDEPVADHDRGLAPRGRRALAVMAEHLREREVRPELVVCSSARRAVDTLEPLRSALGDPEVRIEDALFGATAAELIDRLGTVPDAVDPVMVVGHNPGLQDLVLTLAGGGAGLESLRTKFPTAALATLAFDGAWSELEPGCARLEEYVTPRELS